MNTLWSIRLACLTSQRSRWPSNKSTLPKPCPWPQNRRLSSISELRNQTIRFLWMKFSTAAVGTKLYILFSSSKVLSTHRWVVTYNTSSYSKNYFFFVPPSPISLFLFLLFLLYLLSNFPTGVCMNLKPKKNWPLFENQHNHTAYIYSSMWDVPLMHFCTEHILSVPLTTHFAKPLFAWRYTQCYSLSSNSTLLWKTSSGRPLHPDIPPWQIC